LDIEASQTGRNVVTRGISINDLIGKEIKLGDVKIKGEELCDPCKTLGTRLSTNGIPPPAIVKALVKRGGLRASILNDGVIRKGDRIKL
ncbi:MAG: sulfurase, partial [Gammaproteobacteria bacterium]|nr:sulfurase [Gammaproteobacteria bacterium]